MQMQYREKKNRQEENKRLVACSTRETRAAGIIVDCFSGDVEAEAALSTLLIGTDGSIRKRHTRIAPTPIIMTLRSVKAIFLGEEKYKPLFMCSQKIPLRPYVNQLANNAV